jgi:predicted Zn finger-like uncharacterized protein
MSAENDLIAQCPQCGSKFRLTPQHLQAAKGWVQCGMCGHVFHSGINTAAVGTPPSPGQPAEKQPEPPVEAPATAEAPPAEVAAEAERAPATSQAAEPETASAPMLAGLSQRMAEQSDVPSSFGPKLESIILVDPNLPAADEDYGPMPVIESKTEAAKPEAPPAYAPATPPPGGWGARRQTATSTGWIPRRPESSAPRMQPVKKRKLGWLWALLILALLLVLAAQTAYYMRDRLAASYPEFRPFLEAVCDDLNCTLNLPRDTKQVLILGSDLQTEDAGHLALEVTLANRAAHAMAWPVLELTLTDVEDQPVARRMFAPSEYLPSGKMESAGIQARSEIPLNLQLQSKGLKAAGYRLRMFY